MRQVIRPAIVVCIILFWFQSAPAQQASQAPGYHQWWRDQPFGAESGGIRVKPTHLIPLKNPLKWPNHPRFRGRKRG